jgi:CheY-like chemotaxis protein
MVELMGGSIWVESKAGYGSTFHFEILVHLNRDTETARPPELALFKGQHLLIVDASPFTRAHIVRNARQWGFKTTEMENGQQASEAILQGRTFDLAIVGVQVGDSESLRWIGELKQKAASKLPQFIMLAPIGSSIQTDASWFSATLTKPLKFAMLQAGLFRALDGAKSVEKRSAPPPVKQGATLGSRFPIRILVTDDNAINQKVLLSLLQRMGYKADIANNGLEACDALAGGAYDMVFMDVQMPKLDGIEATRRIRAREREKARHSKENEPAIIIALTARAMAGDRENCLAAGMDDFLTKPVRTEALQTVVENWGPAILNRIQKAALASSVQELHPFPPQTAAEPPIPQEKSSGDGQAPVDMERLMDFAGGDESGFRELSALYLDQTSARLVQLQGAVASGAIKDVQHLAHSGAGASGTCGMGGMTKLLSEMERLAMEGQTSGLQPLLKEILIEFDRVRKFLEKRLVNP